MSRKLLSSVLASGGLVMAAAIFAPSLQADVKTRQKSQVKFEGIVGRLVGMAGGSAAKDGLTSTVAVKGHRMATVNEQNGQIIDLSEEKVYTVDFKKKEYRATTFAEMREQMKKARADAEKSAKDMSAEDRAELEQAGKQMEISFDVKQTGESKTVMGHAAKQVIVTVTAHEKGKTVEEGGGMVMTNELWVGPRIAALRELSDFNLKYVKALYGEAAGEMGQQFASLSAMYPGIQDVMKNMEEQMKKIDGTPLLTITKVETVKSAAAMAQAPASTGGGLGGALARRIGGNKKPEQRSLLLTSTNETLSVDAASSETDVAIPAGFKEKK